jgi:hypothetical protein
MALHVLVCHMLCPSGDYQIVGIQVPKSIQAASIQSTDDRVVNLDRTLHIRVQI